MIENLKQVIEVHKNLCLRSDEPGEVLNLLGDLQDGKADEAMTKEYIDTLVIAVESVTTFLVSIGEGNRVKVIFKKG